MARLVGESGQESTAFASTAAAEEEERPRPPPVGGTNSPDLRLSDNCIRKW
jgi:hypothetical protein